MKTEAETIKEVQRLIREHKGMLLRLEREMFTWKLDKKSLFDKIKGITPQNRELH